MPFVKGDPNINRTGLHRDCDKPFKKALLRLMKEHRWDLIAEKIWKAAEQEDDKALMKWAIELLIDRVDGKAVATLEAELTEKVITIGKPIPPEELDQEDD